MWNRFDLKNYSKSRMSTNYWRMVLAAFIIALVTGGTASFSYKGNATNLKNIFSSDYSVSSSIGGAIGDLRDATGSLRDFADEHSHEAAGVLVWPVVLIAFVIALIGVAIGLAFGIFLRNPLLVGGSRFFMENHSCDAKVEAFGVAFRGAYSNVVFTMFLRDLYVFLWSLLLVIPGIIKSYEYRMVPYILADNPSIDREEAFELSRRMMDGNKWDAFVLDLSFIGWYILSAFTAGLLGVFYVNPFKFQTDAELYMALRSVPFDNGYYDNSYVEMQ